jgi:hypothetical protein
MDRTRRLSALSWLGVVASGFTRARAEEPQAAAGPKASAGSIEPRSTFLQAGAGATPRSLQSKAREFVSALDFIGDGQSAAGDIGRALRLASAAAAGGATASRIVRLPAGTFHLDAGITLEPGVSLVGDGSGQTIIEFRGSGVALTMRNPREFGGFSLVSKAPGQSGALVRGGNGVRIRDIRCLDFDGVGFQLGIAGVTGVYFADVDYVECTNNARAGRVGFLIDGLAIPNSNANVCTNVFVKGQWHTLYNIRGNANILIGGDAEPHHASAPVSEVYRVEGIGNKILGPYVEPAGGKAPPCYFRFASASQSNRIQGAYCTFVDTSSFAKIDDRGVNNEVEINQNGFNFAASPGLHRSPQNLLPNAGFRNPGPSAVPQGWTQSGTGSAVRTSGVVRGQAYSMELKVERQQHSLAALVAVESGGAPSRQPLLSMHLGKFRGTTAAVGVWCRSNVPHLGAIKLYTGRVAVGTAKHSGSGEWEFLVASGRIEADARELGIILRTDTANAPATGVCHFSEPVLVLGNEISQAALPLALSDGDSALAGRLTWNPPVSLAMNSPAPSVAEANFFVEGNTRPTMITHFEDGRPGQEIKILASSSLTTLANGATLVTTTGANKPLVAKTVYKLIFDGRCWYEF